MRDTASSIVSRAEQPEVQSEEATRPAAGPRLAPYLSLEPVAWWERQCPSCNKSFTRNVAVCPVDSTPLKRVEVSLPFLWIG